MQRHLNLPWRADRVLHYAQAGRAEVESACAAGSRWSAAARRQRRLSGRNSEREGVVVEVLRNLVAGNVEAGGVCHVVHVECVFHVESFRDGENLDQRSVRTFLGRLAEYVALSGGESGFVGIGGGNCTTEAVRNQRQGEAGRVERRLAP